MLGTYVCNYLGMLIDRFLHTSLKARGHQQFQCYLPTYAGISYVL